MRENIVTIVNIVSALCLIYMVGVVVYAAVPIVNAKNRGERLKLLSGFKKGKFVLIYFAAIPLYLVAHVFNGEAAAGALWMAIKSCVDTVILKFDYSSAAALMSENVFYTVVIEICFVLVVVNAALFAAALFGQRVYNFVRARCAWRAKKLYVIVGLNKHNIELLASVGRDAGAVLVADGSKEARDAAYFVKRAAVALDDDEDLARLIESRVGDMTDKKVYVIINTGDDTRNVILCEQLSELIVKLNYQRPDIETGFFAYVLGLTENRSTFTHFAEKTHGRLRYVDKYKLVADRFALAHPMTEFMTDREIEFDRATIRPEVDLGFVMIGFGRTNRRIFLNAVTDNQFLMHTDKGLEQKRVTYTVFDRVDSQNDKNLNHSYFRYRNTLTLAKGKEDEYLPLPPEPAVTNFFKLDINEGEFYFRLREALLAKEGRAAYNYIVIGFGSDLENLDLADKIYAKIREWGVAEYTRLFVKIRDGKLSREVVAKEYCRATEFYTFGEEDVNVYNVDVIGSEPEERMAWRRHLAYTAEWHRNDAEIDENGVKKQDVVMSEALDKWYGDFSQSQRDSNIAACRNIRTKLNLIGFDYAPGDAPQKDESERFVKAYTEGDPVRYTGETFAGKKMVEYRNADFDRDSVRKTFAVQEHQRWNASMIACGIVPSTRKQIENGDSKNLKLRRHGNITTFEGLIEFRKIVAKIKGKSEENTDVIRYDYQILDDLLWMFDVNGFKVIDKKFKTQYDIDKAVLNEKIARGLVKPEGSKKENDAQKGAAVKEKL